MLSGIGNVTTSGIMTSPPQSNPDAPALLVGKQQRILGERTLLIFPWEDPSWFQPLALSIRPTKKATLPSAGSYINVYFNNKLVVLEVEGRAPFGITSSAK